MKDYSYRNLSKSISLVIFFISLISLNSNFLKAEYLIEESEIDVSTKTVDNNSFYLISKFFNARKFLLT